MVEALRPAISSRFSGGLVLEKVLVNNIQGYSIHDGPGIRTTVFLKGCNLRCEWCQNPEGLSGLRQIGFNAQLCHGCGKCLQTCQHGAIVAEPGKHRVDNAKCIACGDCVATCYYGALVSYGDPMTAKEVFDEVKKDIIFYEASGGGVTVSGGEPMLHVEFVRDLLKMLKGAGIHTAVETAGCVPRASFEKVIDLVDLFLFDIKHANPLKHKQYTGQSNSLIFDNATALVSEGADVLFRMPLLAGVNDSDENIAQTAEFVKRIRNPHLQLMPYHRMGQSKYDILNMPYPAIDVPVMEASEVEAVRQRFEELGVDCSISK